MAQAQLPTLGQTTLLSATTGKLDVCLLPLWQKRLLLPAVTVLDVLPATGIKSPKKAKKNGLLGQILWNSEQVPVVNFEVLCGLSATSEPQKVAIIHSINHNEKLSHYAIALQAEPLAVKVKIAELEDLEKATVTAMEYLQVRYQEAMAVIPDLDALEAKILTLI